MPSSRTPRTMSTTASKRWPSRRRTPRRAHAEAVGPRLARQSWRATSTSSTSHQLDAVELDLAVMGRLRAIGAILRAAAGLDATAAPPSAPHWGRRSGDARRWPARPAPAAERHEWRRSPPASNRDGARNRRERSSSAFLGRCGCLGGAARRNSSVGGLAPARAEDRIGKIERKRRVESGVGKREGRRGEHGGPNHCSGTRPPKAGAARGRPRGTTARR